jgi:hypothetical protein
MSLHALWDDFILGSARFQSVRNTSTELRLQPHHARAQLPELTDTDFEHWATQESFRMARDHAYRHGQLHGNTDKDQGVVLPADYIPAVKPLAERRIVLAGYRLADVLREVFAQGGTPPALSATPSAAPRTSPAAASGEVHGNRRSKVYHLPSCPGYENMSPANLVPFATEAEARETGYRKAGNCHEKSRWVPHSLLWGGKRAARRAATISVWPTKQVPMPFMT